MTWKTPTPYAERVRQLEAEGLTTSDAQAVADAERKPTPGLLAALMLIRDRSPYFDIWGLAGPSNSRVRAEIASLLAGERVPVKAAGVTAIETFLLALAPVAGDCYASRRDALAAWCRTVLITAGRMKS